MSLATVVLRVQLLPFCMPARGGWLSNEGPYEESTHRETTQARR